jgi:hypothetical protein
MRMQTVIAEDTTEAIVRVYLQDRSYKSVRVTVDHTAEDVTKTLRLKLGKDWYASGSMLCRHPSDRRLNRRRAMYRVSDYALYKFQHENERLVTPGTKILDVMKQHNTNNGPLIWIFKEMPDAEVRIYTSV